MFLKNKMLLMLLASLGLVIVGCSGDDGADGLTGPGGDPGVGFNYTYAGNVETAAGAAGENNLVILKALDPDGSPLADISAALTAADGTFSIGSTVDATSVPLGLQAIVGTTSLRAFLINTTDQDVSPVTEGVFDLVTMVTGSMDGRSMDDYSVADILALVTAAEAALTTAGTDLTDLAAVRAQLLTDIGGQLADLSGGTYTIEASGSPVSVDPADVTTAITDFYVELTDGSGELWDIQSAGSISDGSDDSYDTMFELEIDGTDFPGQPAPSATAQLEDGREVVLGPVSDASGLDITRKIYVSETYSFARFAEILENPTGSDITVDVLVNGNLGSDESTDAVHFSSSGDGIADSTDIWITMKWDDDPTVGFWFPGANPSKSDDNIDYIWEDVLVPAGETIIVVHWGFQNSSNDPAYMAAELTALAMSVPGYMYEGMSIAEGAAAPFVDGTPNVVGEAGAVAPLASIDVENLTSGTTRSAVAAADGSFSFFLRYTTIGDQVQLIASDGTDDTVTVQ